MNVYYLPARELSTPDLVLPVSRWSVLRARSWRGWCRFRLTAAEVLSVIRRSGRRSAIEEHVWFAPQVSAPRRRALGPARVLDFEAARRRRALAPAPSRV